MTTAAVILTLTYDQDFLFGSSGARSVHKRDQTRATETFHFSITMRSEQERVSFIQCLTNSSYGLTMFLFSLYSPIKILSLLKHTAAGKQNFLKTIPRSTRGFLTDRHKLFSVRFSCFLKTFLIG